MTIHNKKIEKIEFKKKYEKKWMAFDNKGKVILANANLKKLANDLKKKGYGMNDYSLEKVLPKKEVFVHRFV